MPFYTHSPEHILTETMDGVTYRGQWFINHQVVVLYVGASGPLTKMLLRDSPEATAQQLFQEFLADESSRHRMRDSTRFERGKAQGD
jgi:hypothetical protein